MSSSPVIANDDFLLRRPEARAFKIDDLMADLQHGRVRIPDFQRGLKWKRDDALLLLDSLFRGYPIGTLLIWETRAEAGTVRFGTVLVDAPGRPDAFWVVDGQQRLVSLARVLLAPGIDVDEFAAFFDLDTGRFVPPPALKQRQADPSRWVPLTEVLDAERLLQWILEHAASAEHRERRERAGQLGKRLREYEVPVYIVRTDREDALRDVFKRVNSAGERMVEHEVFEALHSSRTGARPSSLNQINTLLKDLEFGTVDEKILYSLLRVLQGQDVSDRAGHGALRLSSVEAEQAYRQTEAAIREVILFLKRDAGIPHYALLPYKKPLVTLGKFFHHHASPLPRSRELLVRWLWRGALSGAHRGDTVSTRAALDRVDPVDETGSVQRLLEQVNVEPLALPSATAPFNFRFAASKLLILGLMDLRPRDLVSSAPVDAASLLGDEPDNGTPPCIPIIVSGEHDALMQSAANRLVQTPAAGLRRKLLQVSDGEVLASHGISPEAFTALQSGDAARFLELRASHLQAHFDAFFDRRTRRRETDRPPLEALLVADEDF